MQGLSRRLNNVRNQIQVPTLFVDRDLSNVVWKSQGRVCGGFIRVPAHRVVEGIEGVDYLAKNAAHEDRS